MGNPLRNTLNILSRGNGWTLEDGVNLIRASQALAHSCGYHATLGGGVINVGFSKKDVDIFYIPLNTQHTRDEQQLIGGLKALWGACRKMQVADGYILRDMVHSSYAHLLKFSVGGCPIDVFIVGENDVVKTTKRLQGAA